MLNRLALKSEIRSRFSVSDILILFDGSLSFLKKNAFLRGQKFLLGDDRIAVLLLMNFTAQILYILKKCGHIYPKPCFNTKIEEITGVQKSAPSDNLLVATCRSNYFHSLYWDI